MPNGKTRFVFCNDGGSLLGPNGEAPIGADGLEELVIGRLRDTQIDTLYWQLGTDPYLSTLTRRISDVYSHRTKVGPMWGDDIDQFATSGEWRMYENTRQMIEAGTDPAEVVVERGKAAGLEVFLSMRVNDMHDGLFVGGDPPYLSATKRAHRDWLLGPVENPFGDARLQGLSRFAYNFALSDVRNYRLAIAKEGIDNYNVDGFDWDFCRHPRFFPTGKERQSAPLMTQVMRELRRILDRKGEQVGRRLLMSVRVPPKLNQALAAGLDVKTWIHEGLVDIVIAGVVSSNMHRVPVEDLIEAARGTDTQVLAQNLGLFWLGRPNSAKVLFREPQLYTPEMCRAAAATYWQAGVDGLYLWNNHLIEFNRDAEYDHQPWKEIADPQLIARRDKHYALDRPQDWDVIKHELGAPPVPQGPLPVELDKSGDKVELAIDIADDLAAARSDGGLKSAMLRVLIINLTAKDDVAFELNGERLNLTSATKRINYNDCWLDFDVTSGPLRQGWNELALRVNSRNAHVSAPLKVESVETIVKYI